MKRPNRTLRTSQAQPGRSIVAAPVVQELTIAAMGARGDAVANGPTGPIYAPFALPGERLRGRISGDRAEIAEVLEPSPERQSPACGHFGRCGGCQLQHWNDTPYLAWKREQVVQALDRRGLGGASVDDTIPAWGAGRRRAALHAGRQGGRVHIGFIERGGARLTPITECPVLAPPLEALVLRLGPLAERVLPARGDITLACLLTDAGADLAIKGVGRDALLCTAFADLVAMADILDLARLSIDGETVVTRTQPTLRMGRAVVRPPPGAFTQPTVLGEETLARLALQALHGAQRVIDLFSGIGTFALRAAEQAEVLSVEGDGEMLAALKGAADAAGGALKQVTILRRDLLRTPLSSVEMKKYDGAVIDPPRSGARLQVEQIARGPVRRLAYVSCDPASFARDVKILVEHGFALTRVTPVDQFRWSPHVEVVGALER